MAEYLDTWSDYAFDAFAIKIEFRKSFLDLSWVRLVLNALVCPFDDSAQYDGFFVICGSWTQPTSHS